MRLRLMKRPAAAALGLALIVAMPATALAGPGAGGSSSSTTTSTAPVPPYPMAPVPPYLTPPPGDKAGAATAMISKEEALAIVQRYFALPQGRGKVELSLATTGGRALWQLNYTITEANSSSSYGFGTVDAATGRILSFQTGNPEARPLRTGPLGKPYPEEQAKAKAWSLVQAMYPEESATLRAAPDWLSGRLFGQPAGAYQFTWIPYRNDLPVVVHQVSVSIDRYSGAYLALSGGDHSELRFPEGSPAVTAAEAAARLQEALTPTLVYRPEYTNKGLPAAKLTLLYRIDQAAATVDAFTGKLIDTNGQAIDTLTQPQPVPAAAGLPQRPQTLPLTPSGAIAFARTVLALPEEARPEVLQTFPRPHQDEGMTVQWYDRGQSGSLTLDPETGRISQAQRQLPLTGGEESTPATEEQKAKAREAAVAVVQAYYADLIPDLRLNPIPPPHFGNPDQISFYFQRYHEGIMVENQGIGVTINLRDSRWTQFSAQWTETEFPSAADCITPAAAKQLYLANQEAVAHYQPKFDPYRRWDDPGPLDLMLVYQLAPRTGGQLVGLIDARTGVPVDWTGRPAAPLADAEAIFAQHWAGGELLSLLDRTAITQVDPGSALSRKAALQLLLAGTNQLGRYWGPVEQKYVDVPAESEVGMLVASAMARGVLRPAGPAPSFGPEQSITRAEFALWIARWLGLGQVTRSNLHATSDFTDLAGLTAEERNAVVLLEALGIVRSGERFRGDEPLTQAEGAVMTVRLLQLDQNR